MNDGIEALKSNNTWTLVDRPTNANILGLKWVFRTKFNEDGIVERLKLALWPKGIARFMVWIMMRSLVQL